MRRRLAHFVALHPDFRDVAIADPRQAECVAESVPVQDRDQRTRVTASASFLGGQEGLRGPAYIRHLVWLRHEGGRQVIDGARDRQR